MKTVRIRNMEVGAGPVKVIVPIVGKTGADIVDKGKELRTIPLHMVEWRADFFEDVLDLEKTLHTLKDLRAALGDIPLLFTFRTDREGGERAISMEQYTALNKAVAESGNADVIDVEIFSGEAVVRENISAIHAAGVKVIGSSHDFHGTPDKADLIGRLRKAQDMEADIAKIAVMPQSRADVLTLLEATEEMHRCYADRPIITMSMSGMGVISRLCGEVFGSAMTFGAVGQTSAPGQISVEQLNQVLEIIHNAS